MKKFIAILLCVLFVGSVFAACGNVSTPADQKLSIVTTIFPEYDWVLNILGDKASQAEVTLLLDSGIDLHSFQPTADDIIKISRCDLFIYTGGESDAWVEDALKESVNPDMKVINLLDTLGDSVKEEELKEGMKAEEEHEHEEEEGPEYDEHVWLSLKNAVSLVNAISGVLTELDGKNAQVYSANTSAYIEKLNSLDAKYTEAVQNARLKTLVFADRFPFRYMTDDYGLDYFAAFVGCSAESEADFETVAFLANKTDELGLSAVLTLEGTDHRIAQTVISATKAKNAKILSMDSMQSVTAADIDNGADYLSIMESNLAVLTDALK